MHDMGQMKRKNYELIKSQCKKLKRKNETIQKLTSQLQEMQDQMNSMNDSGEFQEVESNYSDCLTFPVSLH